MLAAAVILCFVTGGLCFFALGGCVWRIRNMVWRDDLSVFNISHHRVADIALGQLFVAWLMGFLGINRFYGALQFHTGFWAPVVATPLWFFQWVGAFVAICGIAWWSVRLALPDSPSGRKVANLICLSGFLFTAGLAFLLVFY